MPEPVDVGVSSGPQTGAAKLEAQAATRAEGEADMLVSVDVAEIELPYVLTSDAPGLVPVVVRSQCSRPIDVHLSSSLPEQLSFQLRNENLQTGGDAAAASPDDDPADWNDLFNEVGRVEHVRLAPFASCPLVVCYRPKELATPELRASGPEDASTPPSLLELNAELMEFRAPRRYYSISSVRAAIFVDAAVADDAAPERGAHAAALPEGRQTQRLLVDFAARMCRAVLKTDVQELIFDDCLVDRSAVKDFTVWNCSEVPIRFRLNIVRRQRRGGDLEFTKLDSGMPVTEAGETINGFSGERIRVAYVPRQAGRHSMELEVANLTDTRSSQAIRVQTLVSTEPLAEGLVLSGGGQLDFGDCYTGMPKRQLLVVRNISEDTLEVHFSSEVLAEVSFDLHTEYDGEAGARTKVAPDELHGSAAALGDAAGMQESGAHTLELVAEENEGGGRLSVDRMRRIEELSIEPGRERAVYVWYQPAPLDDGPASSRLSRRTFQIQLRVQSPRRQREWHVQSVQCRARVCTSTVSVSPALLNLGDCDIQTLKVATAFIKNNADLPATLAVSMQSKVLSTPDSLITIAPRSSYELKLHFVPRRVNPDYRKQVTITNKNNRADEHQVEVVANNVDRHNVSFHSLFYNIALLRSPADNGNGAGGSVGGLSELTKVPPDKCRIKFDDVVARCVHVRVLSVRNISKKPLQLQLDCSVPHGGRIRLYRQGDGASDEPQRPLRAAVQDAPTSGRDKLEQLLQRFEAQQPRGLNASITLEDSQVRPSCGAAVWDSGREVQFEGVRRILSHEEGRLAQLGRTASADDGERPSSAHGARAGLQLARSATPATLFAPALHGADRPAGGGKAGLAHLSHAPAGRLTAEQMVAVASAFRDLHVSHRQAVAAAAAIDSIGGDASRADGLGRVLEAWRDASTAHASLGAAPPPQQVEAALVTIHTWLRSTVEHWKLTEQILPLSASAGLLLLQEGEERVLLVEFVPELPAEQESMSEVSSRVDQELSTSDGSQESKRGGTGASGSSMLRLSHEEKKLKFEGELSVRLVEYDDALRKYHEQRLRRFFPNAPPQPPQMTRVLPVLVTACRSAMEIAQRSINFGVCEAQQLLVKSILLYNSSPAPLLYKVGKTGRHASFDLQICAEDRLGCVRPFGSRMIRFHFRPSLSGEFRETLTVLNVQDASDAQQVLVKAEVRKSVAFHVTAPSLHFGPCYPRQAAVAVHRLVISNVARGARRFTIYCPRLLTLANGVTAPFSAEASFRLEQATADGAEALLQQEQQREELLELYTRKLRIAERKGRTDKVAKLKKKISKLAGSADLEPAPSDLDSDLSDWGGNSESEAEEPPPGRAVRRLAGDSRERALDTLSFKLGRNGTQTVCVALSVLPAPAEGLGGQLPKSNGLPVSRLPLHSSDDAADVAGEEPELSGMLVVYESRDNDSKQQLPFQVTVRRRAAQVSLSPARPAAKASPIVAESLPSSIRDPAPYGSPATLSAVARRGSGSPIESPPGARPSTKTLSSLMSGAVSPRRRCSPTGLRSSCATIRDELLPLLNQPSASEPLVRPPLPVGTHMRPAPPIPPPPPQPTGLSSELGGERSSGAASSVEQGVHIRSSTPIQTHQQQQQRAASPVAAPQSQHGAKSSLPLAQKQPSPSSQGSSCVSSARGEAAAAPVPYDFRIDADLMPEHEAKLHGTAPPLVPLLGGRPIGTLLVEDVGETFVTLTSLVDTPLFLRVEWSSAPPSGVPKLSRMAADDGPRVALALASQHEAGASVCAAAQPSKTASALELTLQPRKGAKLSLCLVLGATERWASPSVSVSQPLGYVTVYPLDPPPGAPPTPSDAVAAEDTAADAAASASVGVGSMTLQLQRRPMALSRSLLRLEPAELDFGEVCSGTDCSEAPPPVLSFQIINTGVADVNFVVMLRKEEQPTQAVREVFRDAPDATPVARKQLSQPPALHLQPHHGLITAGSRCAVEVRCVAPQPGRQRFTVVVRNLSTLQHHTLGIRLRGIHPQRLAFPDLPAGEEPKLSLGLCYIYNTINTGGVALRIDAASPGAGSSGPGGSATAAAAAVRNSRRFLRRVPFRISNLQAGERRLTVSSNLVKQIFIFEDAECKQPAIDLPVPGTQTRTVWICLNPHLSTDVLSGDACRQLVGGIRVVLSDADGTAVDEQTIEIDATIGRSLLRVSRTTVQLGCTLAPKQPEVGIIEIANGSESMPLEWRAPELPPGLSVAPVEGHLAGTGLGAKQSGPVRGVEVELRQHCPYSGYYRRQVRFVDVNAAHDEVRVRVEAMLDDGRLWCELPTGSSGLSQLEAGTLHAVRLRARNPSDSMPRSPITWAESPPSCESPASSHPQSAEADSERHDATERPSCGSGSTLSTNDLSLLDAERAVVSAPPSSCAREFSHSHSPTSSIYESSDTGGVGGADPSGGVRPPRLACSLDVLPGPQNRGGSHCSFLVRNTSAEPLTVQPLSDLPMSTSVSSELATPVYCCVDVGGGGDAVVGCSGSVSGSGSGSGSLAVDRSTSMQDRRLHKRRVSGDAPELVVCGHPFTLLPGVEVELRIQLHVMPRLLAESNANVRADAVGESDRRVQLQLGSLLHWEGLLLLEPMTLPSYPPGEMNLPTAPALKAVRVHGSICVSLVSLPQPMVSLGKVGYVDGWRDVPFSFELRNESAVPTVCRVIDLPEAILLPAATRATDGSLEIRLAEGQSTMVEARLRTSRLSAPQLAEEGAWVLRLCNVHNPSNMLKLHVMAEVTVLRLRYNRLFWPGHGFMPTDPRNSAGVQAPALPEAGVAGDTSVESMVTLADDANEQGAEAAADAAAAIAAVALDGPRRDPACDHELDAAQLDDAVRAQRPAVGTAGGAPTPAALVLPPLLHPPLPSTPPCSAWFELHNCSREPMPLQLSVEPPAAAVAALPHVSLELLLRASHTPVSTLTLAPNEHVELMLRADLAGAASAPAPELLQRPLALGQLRILSAAPAAAAVVDSIDDTIALFGSLTRGMCIALNVTRLNFHGVPVLPLSRAHEFGSPPPTPTARVPQLESFWIRNLSSERPVEVTVVSDVPLHVASVVVSPTQAIIAPNQEVHVSVQVLPHVSRYDEDEARIRVHELNAPGYDASIKLALVERQADSTVSPKAAGMAQPLPLSLGGSGPSPFVLDAPSASEAEPRIALRGVASVRGSCRRHEVNLGQQNFGSGGVQWELRVENLSARAVRYRLFTMSTEEGEEWLTFSRTSGTLAQQHETQVVTLHCSTEKLEIYPTYVVVENLDNADDLKTVLVSMEMVVSRVTAASYFSVIVDGKARSRAAHIAESRSAPRPSELSINLGDVYYGVLYVNRSFMVQNHSTMPLHFMISHNLRRSSPTEINFSLSNLSLKLFSTLLVPPNSATRVFLHFRTSAPADVTSTAAAAAAAAAASASGGTAAAPSGPAGSAVVVAPPTAAMIRSASASVAAAAAQGIAPAPGAASSVGDVGGEAERLQVDISVSCHLVKDYHKVIRLSARCHPPQLGLSHTDVEFGAPRIETSAPHLPRLAGSSAKASPPLRTPKLEPKQQTIGVCNLGSDPLAYAVRSSCCFFHVRTDFDDALIGTDNAPPHTITVTPNESAIQQHAAFLSKARYIEEHFTVYNRNDLNEHKQVLVRLSCGHQHQQTFSYAPSKPIYSTSVLEEEILSFHSAFKAFWDMQFTEMLAGVAPTPADAPVPAAGVDLNASITAALVRKCEAVAEDETYRRLWFDFRHITDELVFFAMKAQTSHFVSPLASLCYKMLFRHEVFDVFAGSHSKNRRLPITAAEPSLFPPQLLQWVKQLSYFLMHFPDVHSGIEPLRLLESTLLRHATAPSVDSAQPANTGNGGGPSTSRRPS